MITRNFNENWRTAIFEQFTVWRIVCQYESVVVVVLTLCLPCVALP